MQPACAIIVTYNPDPLLLDRVVAAVASQVERIYLVDNGSEPALVPSFADRQQVETIPLCGNRGVAAAFNAGVDQSAAAGYRYLLLLDQDSVVPPGTVRRYLEVMQQLQAAGIRVAALGPRYRDRRTGHTSRFVRFCWFRNTYVGCSRAPAVIAADFLISSGSFYDRRSFAEVGPFDERLFIDHVDTEWFHRAGSHGYCTFGLWDVVLEHSLGEGSFRLWFGRWRQQPLHKPFRLYYIVRNSLLLYRLPHTPRKWISSDLFRLLRLMVIYLLFSSQRRQALLWIGRGIRDGLHGIDGPCPYPG